MSEASIVSQETDEILVLRLQDGQIEALGVLYDRYRQMVYRTALAITSDAETAADLLHDVFLRLYRFAHRIDPQRPVRPWLYRITANLAYTWLKRRKRSLHGLAEMAASLARDPKPTPHALAEKDEQWNFIQQAIAALPLAQRVVVVLYYVNDLSLQEIAEILEVPVGTVKSRLYYGRRALKGHLGFDRDMAAEVLYEFT
jgi:RNA polymerase sigma-70 factor (ECF subfamily)